MIRLVVVLVLVLLAAPAWAATDVVVGYISRERPSKLPVGPLDETATDEGLAGVRLGIADDATTGRFAGQGYRLVEHVLKSGEEVAPAVAELRRQGASLMVADLDRDDLLKAADAAKEGGLVFNIRATDDALRNSDCRANILHTVPSDSMVADGLAQYLVWKNWKRWFLVFGNTPADEFYAKAIERSAERLGAEIVEEKNWTFALGNGRSDTGHVLLQTEIPTFTRTSDYDVLVVADRSDAFGAFLEGRTDRPRQIVGTHGLIATAWSPVAEQWGATQLQNRFHRQSNRWMTQGDYAGWLAARAIGEAAMRSRSSDAAAIGTYLRGKDFLLAAFKGVGLTFRPWDGQIREPILITGSRLLVSVSPQPGFLHPGTELDTLGSDQQESQCHF